MADDSPRRRLVRLEKETYTDDIAESQTHGSAFLIDANATIKKRREEKRATLNEGKGLMGAAVQARKNAQQFQQSLDTAVGGPSPARDKLMKDHMTSSASSPFLSGTPSFTTGENSQLYYMGQNLQSNKTQIVTIHNSPRALANPHNTREAEVLVPHGERLDERIGIFHVSPVNGGKQVRPLFIDKTGDKPRLYTGKSAITRFKELSQK